MVRRSRTVHPRGTPFRVSLRRVRRTVQVLIRKQPAQNTEETHESVYVLRDPAARAEAQQTIAQGPHRRTRPRPRCGEDANHARRQRQ